MRRVTALFLLFVLAISAAEEQKAIIVVSNGWHSGLVFYVEDVNQNIWPESRGFPGFRYIEVGWGDAAFYQKAEPGTWDYLYAALWPSASLLHVRAYHTVPRYPQSKSLWFDSQSYDAVCRFVSRFYLRKAGVAAPLGPGLFPHSLFYHSNYPYHLLRTCNVWTAQALRAGGIGLEMSRAVRSDDLFEQLNE